MGPNLQLDDDDGLGRFPQKSKFYNLIKKYRDFKVARSYMFFLSKKEDIRGPISCRLRKIKTP